MSLLAENTQSAILERVVRPKGAGMTVAAAKSMLQMKFAPADVRRMRQLLAAAQESELTADEANELEAYRNVGHMVDLLQSQARRVLTTRRKR